MKKSVMRKMVLASMASSMFMSLVSTNSMAGNGSVEPDLSGGNAVYGGDAGDAEKAEKAEKAGKAGKGATSW